MNRSILRLLAWAAVTVSLASTAFADPRAAGDPPSALYCETNAKAAAAAADEALRNMHELKRGEMGLATGGSCLLVLYGTAWFDGGISTGVCALLAAAAVVATPPADSAKAAADAYDAARDPRCVGN